MRIAIFGLGYVGTVTAACLADAGHRVVGVDVNPAKVNAVQRGESPVLEPGLAELVRRLVAEDHLDATTDYLAAVAKSDVVLVCVGTPSRGNGSLDLTALTSVTRQIGEALRAAEAPKLIVFRSTVLPGTTSRMVDLLQVTSGRKAGPDFHVCYNPEFLREGTALRDFACPPYTVIGTDDEDAAAVLQDLYSSVDAPVIKAAIPVAEMVKYANNAFHALKITFANEIGNICKRLGIESHQVMDIVCQDTKLNLSPYYLKPGFAFGGSCLPKDLRALTYKAKELDLEVPVLRSILESNRLQLQLGIEAVVQQGGRKIGVLGLTFKAGTDDLRESPLMQLVEILYGKGYALKVYDPNLALDRLVGGNRAYLEERLPHISALLAETLAEVVEWAEVVVIGSTTAEVRDIPRYLSPEKKVVDLVRLVDQWDEAWGSYHGLCW